MYEAGTDTCCVRLSVDEYSMYSVPLPLYIFFWSFQLFQNIYYFLKIIVY